MRYPEIYCRAENEADTAVRRARAGILSGVMTLLMTNDHTALWAKHIARTATTSVWWRAHHETLQALRALSGERGGGPDVCTFDERDDAAHIYVGVDAVAASVAMDRLYERFPVLYEGRSMEEITGCEEAYGELLAAEEGYGRRRFGGEPVLLTLRKSKERSTRK